MRSADTAKGVQVVETLFEVLEDRQIEHSEAVTELLEVE